MIDFGDPETWGMKVDGFTAKYSEAEKLKKQKYYLEKIKDNPEIEARRELTTKSWRESLPDKAPAGFVEEYIDSVYEPIDGKLKRRYDTKITLPELAEKYNLTFSKVKETTSQIKKRLEAQNKIITDPINKIRAERITKGSRFAGEESKKINKEIRKKFILEPNKIYINLLKEDPNGLVNSIRQNSELMDQLSSRFDSKTGKIYNVKLSDNDIKQYVKRGLLSEEHSTRVGTAARNIEFPTNKSIVTTVANKKVLAPLNVWLNKNYDPRNPIVQEQKDWLTKNNLRTKIAGMSGYFGDESLKSMSAIEAQTKQFQNIAPSKTVSKGPTLGMNLGLGKKLLTAFEVLGTPAASGAFAVSEYLRGRDEGKTRFEAATDPNVGLSLLAPGVASRLNPGLLKGVLGLGKAARFFTPTGVGLTLAGELKKSYDDYQRVQKMKKEQPKEYEKFLKTRVSEPMSQEEYTAIEDMGREGAMGGGIMRVGYANGPEDPLKRKTLKGLLGIAAMLPFGVGKLISKSAPAVEKAAPAVQQGWSWVKDNFWTVYNTVNKKAKTFAKLKEGEVKMHKDIEVIENPNSIRIKYRTDNGNPAETVYNKPYKEVDPETGNVIEVPGEFEEYQDVYRMGKDDYYKDFEEEIIDPIEDVKKILKED